MKYSILLLFVFSVISFVWASDYHASYVFEFMDTYSVEAVKEGNLIFEDVDDNIITNIAEVETWSLITIKDKDADKVYNVMLFKPNAFQKELEEKIEDNADQMSWKEIDTNCTKDDIQFVYNGNDYFNYKWVTFHRAGCNSTLWGAQYSKDYSDNKLYQWSNINETQWLKYDCRISQNNGFEWSNNTNCPCPNGRHIPDSREWNILSLYFDSDDTRDSGIADSLWLPLAGFCNDISCYGHSQYTFLWLSQVWVDDKTAYAPFVSSSNPYITLNSKSFSDYYPVRCVRDVTIED